MTAVDRLLFNFISSLMAGMGLLSPRRGRRLADLLGGLWFFLDRHHRRITLGNLRLAYGREMNRDRIRRLGRRVFVNTVRMIFEYAWYYRKGTRNYHRYITLKGMVHLFRAHARGKGVLILTGHLGNWEMALSLGPMTGLPVSVVYRTIKSRAIDTFIHRNRARAGCRLFALHKALDAVLEALGRGDVVGLLVDQNSGRAKGVFVDFFGKKACSSKGLARLALDTGAPVVPVFIYREGENYALEALPEIPLVRTGDPDRDIVENTRNYHRVIEAMVRRYPDQWFWVHKRWKTRPADRDA